MQAPVEIRYEGAVLAKAVAPSGSLEEGGTLFLPLADPMPVGTRLELWSADETTLVRVVKVTESPDAAGVSVRHINIAEPVEIFDPEPSVSTAVAPTPVAATATAPAPRPAAAAAPPSSPEAPAPPANLPVPVVPAGANGANRSGPVAVSGTINNPAVTSASGVIGEPMDAGESSEVEDTTTTSEYPALPNGTGTKRRKKARKAPR